MCLPNAAGMLRFAVFKAHAIPMKGAACYASWIEGILLSKKLSAIKQHRDETMTAIKQHFLTSLQS
jgi:hypothetical protein